ncbi:MAG: hypothetical protein KME45_16455 [Stenomitos rutilans HA7619-LM2]|jgi:hypothetical protein|nr:hypothetical protein [Stenomitos rutilans HA7619-LM2]
MTELVNHSTERSNDAAACAIKLLHHYGFDLGGQLLSQLLIDWQQHYPTAWIRLATIEALYQGRYKAISVEQILAMWQRRSQPLPHFNHEFERLVCDHLPDHQAVSTASTQRESPSSRSTPLSTQAPQYRAALQLPHFERSPLPEADVMLALRTLHSQEMAALQEAAIAEVAQTEALPATQTDDHSSAQTYSYSLRSSEPSSPSVAQEQDAATEQEEREPPRLMEDTQTTKENQQGETGQDADVNESPVSSAASPEEPFAALNAQSDNEPDHHQLTENSVSTSPPLSEVQALQLPPVGTIAKILQQLEHQELQAKVNLPALGLITATLKPKLQSHLTTPYQPSWLTDPSRKQPIHQFTPNSEPSDFYSKLKTVAQPLEEPQEDVS